jgi:hypothetical protein
MLVQDLKQEEKQPKPLEQTPPYSSLLPSSMQSKTEQEQEQNQEHKSEKKPLHQSWNFLAGPDKDQNRKQKQKQKEPEQQVTWLICPWRQIHRQRQSHRQSQS